MRIIGSVSAWKDDLDHALGRLAALGFTEVDLIVMDSWGLIKMSALRVDFDAEVSRVEGLLAKHGLRAVSLNTAFKPDLYDRSDAAGNLARMEEVRLLGRLMMRLGIERGAHYPGYIADWKNDPDGVWRDTMESLGDIRAVMADFPTIRLGPELHYRTPFEQPDASRRLIAEYPNGNYAYDLSQFIVLGLDLESSADLLDKAGHVHVRGCAPGQIQAPPQASADSIRWVMERLRARNYTGMVSIEYLPGAAFDVEAAIAELRQMIC